MGVRVCWIWLKNRLVGVRPGKKLEKKAASVARAAVRPGTESYEPNAAAPLTHARHAGAARAGWQLSAASKFKADIAVLI
jgi:hypothetical protein